MQEALPPPPRRRGRERRRFVDGGGEGRDGGVGAGRGRRRRRGSFPICRPAGPAERRSSKSDRKDGGDGPKPRPSPEAGMSPPFERLGDPIRGFGVHGLMLFQDGVAGGFADRARQGSRRRPVGIVVHRLAGPFEDQGLRVHTAEVRRL
ncbi:hypothetical protein ACRAWD_27330 [Caulobacter segnis]